MKKNALWFIHMPKTGGTFIREYFKNEEFFNAFEYRSKKTHDGFNKIEDFQTYYTFGVIRNPWDRLLGTYTWEKRNREKFDWDWSFEKFAKAAPTSYVNDYHKLFCINGELKLDYMVRFETLNEDIKKLLEINNLTMDISVDDYYKKNKNRVEIVNNSKHAHYSIYYTDDLVEYVYEQDKEIIEKFGYKFERKYEFKTLPKKSYVVNIKFEIKKAHKK
jgi:hypothetical protein